MLRKRAVLDIPSDRSMHATPTPRGGGLAIVIVFVFLAVLTAMSGDLARRIVVPLLVGAIPIAIVGWIDDHGHVAPAKRAVVHLASCFLAFLTYEMMWPGLNGLESWVWTGAATIGAAYFLNIFNFMDGIDGLAGSEAAFAGLASIWLFRQAPIASLLPQTFAMPDYAYMGAGHYVVGLATTLAFCCIGFLIWNWPPAKIFMGDVGSGFLGFTIAFFALFDTRVSDRLLWPWLILLGVFVVDGTYTLVTRFLTRQKWHQAHCLHTFQKAAKRSGHLTVTLSVLAINLLWLLPLATYAKSNPSRGPLIMFIAYIPLVLTAWRYKAGVLEPSSTDQPSMAQ